MYHLRMEWRTPIALDFNVLKDRFVANWREVKQEPGVYVFLQPNEKNIPIYAGQTNCVQGRLRSYLEPDHHLKGKLPKEALFYCPCGIYVGDDQALPKRGEDTSHVLDIVETTLIAHLLARKYKLINTRSTKNNHVLQFAESKFEWSPQTVMIPKILEKSLPGPMPK